MFKLFTGFINALVLFMFALCFPVSLFSQIDLSVTSTDNTQCDGEGCGYFGPSILINELMLSPSDNDGSMWGGNGTQAGEWIELYNPDICSPIDISCYYLGNNANDPDPYSGGYVIPAGTVVPAAGFALIRGINADPVPANLLVENGGNVVELVVTGAGVCVGGGNRLWFPNAGGWFAFYDADGVPQDAVSWASQANTDEYPCVPTSPGCTYSGTLANYDEFPADRKNYILNVSAATFQGQSLRRIPDGGAWDEEGPPTYGTCNANCPDPAFIICNGTATANPTGGVAPYTFQWDDPDEQTTPTAENLCAGTYCVTVTDSNGDVEVQCVLVEDYAYESTVEDGFCAGGSYTLPDNTVVNTPGTFTSTFQTVNTCDSTITIILEEYPTYSFNLTEEICSGQTYTLPDGTEVSTDGIYPVALQTINGCDSLFTIDLTVLPPIDVPLDVEICRGESYQLPDGSTVIEEGVYPVLTSGNGIACDTLYTVDLQFYPDIAIDILEQTDITCFGAEDGVITLDVSGGTAPYTYAWSDQIDHGQAASDLAEGFYTVELTDLNGCTADTILEIAEPDPLILTASADTTICFGTSTDLTAIATGGTGAIIYNWSASNLQTGSISVSPDTATVYTVAAQDENGCLSQEATIVVEVINMFPENLVITPDTSICPGETVDIFAEYSGAYPPNTYQWSAPELTGQGPTTVTVDSSVVYELTVLDVCGNAVTDSVAITVFDLPTADLPDVLINGCSPLDVVLVDTLNTLPGLTYQWTLSNGDTYLGNPAEFTLTDPNLYEVFLEISTQEGCKVQSTNAIPIEVFALPTAFFSASTWSTSIETPDITFVNESEGYVLDSWNINGETFENQDEFVYTFPAPGNYPVDLLVENEFGCRDSITRMVEIKIDYDITIPTAFTPGDNGNNPYYDPQGTDNTVFYPFADYVDEYRMSIFNRWGELIFESTEIERGWNGTYRERICPMDVYVYRIDFVFADGTETTKVGDITLIR
ncbi:gliding motility-associated C-terminal domain-containing protein [Cryomorphaceae bacterium 1068]|nr:gliding motility-associated C-terminal domain-containing protein [Cryomorphaceae bacterium 1068]